jgi:hypothetical protein
MFDARIEMAIIASQKALTRPSLRSRADFSGGHIGFANSAFAVYEEHINQLGRNAVLYPAGGA